MAHDFLGNELSIGDYVVFLNYNGTSSNLESGIITRVSEHTAEISGNRRAEYKIIKVNPVRPTMDNTWIPCSERLPEDVSRCLVCRYDYVTKTRFIDILWFESGIWWDGSHGGDYAVTHWQPLPEPPEEEL